MFRVLVDENLTVMISSDNMAYVGNIREVRGQNMRICFHDITDLKVGDQVICNVSRGGIGSSAAARVMAIGGTNCEFWLLVSNVVPGVDRAPRAVAPGTTIVMRNADDETIGSICDVSESGIRIRSLGYFEVGQDLALAMETQMGHIEFKGRVARVVSGVENDSSDIGVQITEFGRLERARYDHFVDGLMRKARKAS